MRRILLAVALFAPAAPAWSAPLRSPQVPFNSIALFNSVGEAINTNTDQLDSPRFVNVAGAMGDPVFELIHGSGRAIGLEMPQPSAPPELIELIAAGAQDGAYAICHFTTTPSVVVTRFDAASVYLGSQTYPGVVRDSVGFYIQGEPGPMYSEDSRNAGGAPQVLTYSAAVYGHDSLICLEAQPFSPLAPEEFMDGVLYLQPAVTCGCTPVRASTWGSVKLRYR
jgi:hypothetical protein